MKPLEIDEKTDKQIREAGFWTGIYTGTGLAAFFLALKQLEESAKIFLQSLVTTIALGEFFKAMFAAYELATLKKANEEKDSDYRERVWVARAKLAAYGAIASLVSVAVFGGTLAAVGVLIVATPPIFVAVGALNFVFDSGMALYHLYKYNQAKTDSVAQQEHWKKVKSHALGAVVALVLVATVALAIMSAPVSFPAMALIGGAIFAGFMAYNVYEKYKKKPEAKDTEEGQLLLDSGSDSDSDDKSELGDEHSASKGVVPLVSDEVVNPLQTQVETEHRESTADTEQTVTLRAGHNGYNNATLLSTARSRSISRDSQGSGSDSHEITGDDDMGLNRLFSSHT